MTQASSSSRRVSFDWKVSHRGVTAKEGQVAQLQASKIERVCYASGSDGGCVDVVDCGPFPTGELDLDSEAF